MFWDEEYIDEKIEGLKGMIENRESGKFKGQKKGERNDEIIFFDENAMVLNYIVEFQ